MATSFNGRRRLYDLQLLSLGHEVADSVEVIVGLHMNRKPPAGQRPWRRGIGASPSSPPLKHASLSIGAVMSSAVTPSHAMAEAREEPWGFRCSERGGSSGTREGDQGRAVSSEIWRREDK